MEVGGKREIIYLSLHSYHHNDQIVSTVQDVYRNHEAY